jgi:calcium-activated chloride channel regulator 4
MKRCFARCRHYLLLCAGAFSLVIALLLAGLPPALYAQDVTSGLLMWLALDENADQVTIRADSSGNNHNGACAGEQCPSAGQPGKVGNMAEFNGQGQRLASDLNAPTGAFTLAGWVRYGGAAFNDWHTIFEFGDDQPWFGANPNGTLTLYPSISGGVIPINQWTYVAYTWDGAQSRLYVNGNAVASNNEAPPVGGQGMLIGAENGSSVTWRGAMDELRIYNRALAENEIKTLAGAGVINVPPPEPPPPPPANETARLVDVSVSIYKPVTTAEARKQYEDLFALFADGIFEVTNGAHKLRNINIYDNGRFSDRADIQWIQFEGQPRASTNAYGRGTVHMGDAIFDQQTTYTNPDNLGVYVTTLVHEWGHYFYGMLDEYRKEGSTSTDPGSPQANDTPPIPQSVMDAAGALDFTKMNFSTRKSTLLAGRTQTAQYRIFQASGWETLSRNPNADPQVTRGSRLYWPDLAATAPALDADASVELPAQRTTARSALTFNWVDTNQGPLKVRMFLVDISADMAQNNKLAGVKAALKSYVDRAANGDRIGIITFADVHTVVQPLTLIDGEATKTAIKTQIDTLAVNAGTRNRMADAADQAAIAAIKQAETGGLITDRSVFVIIDGGFTDQTGEPWVVQKVFNEHQTANIPISIFNFAAQSKDNDIFSNMVPDNMSFPPSCCRPAGVYRFVGQGGFEIPTLQTTGAATVYTIAQEDADFDELIDAWEDVDQEYSDLIDVNLGTAYGSLAADVPFSTQIYADSTLDELEVTVYFTGAPKAIALSLADPDGNQIDDFLCDSDELASFCFVSISAPTVGVWELELAAITTTLVFDYEAHGYVDEGFTYQARVESLAGDTVNYPEQVVLIASVEQVERIARAGLTAWVEAPDGAYNDLALSDDGVAPDETADDGRYTGFLPYDQPGDYYITVIFDNIAGEAHYTKAGMADVTDPVGDMVPDDFDRFATLELFVNDFAADDYGNDAASATDLVSDNADRAGRIDRAGDVDHFRITSPQPLTGDPKTGGGRAIAGELPAASETFVVRLTSFAFGMNARVKITTSAGANEYVTGPLAYNAYWTALVDLTPGEQLDIEVTHVDGQTAGGSYHISFGPPLPGEVQANPTDSSLYLPLVTR